MTQTDVPTREGAKRSLLRILSDRVNDVCEMTLFATLAAMTIVTLAQIIWRIWFRSLTWSEELTCFLLVYASFIGSTVAFKRGANIAVTFLLDRFPAGMRRVFECLIDGVGIAFFGTTAWYGVVLCEQQATQMASSLPISMSWMYLVFPITGAIVILHLLAHVRTLAAGNAQKEGDA